MIIKIQTFYWVVFHSESIGYIFRRNSLGFVYKILENKHIFEKKVITNFYFKVFNSENINNRFRLQEF